MKFFSGGVWKFSPDGELGFFIDFLASDYARRILMESKISIHIDSGNVYYDDGESTNESIYDFFSTKKIKPKR